MESKALLFEQIKQAWLLRRFAPNAAMGYLLVWKLWPYWPSGTKGTKYELMGA